MSDLEDIRTLPIQKLPDRLSVRRYHTPHCLTAFLERCQLETFRNPHEAVDLCAHGPDFVDCVYEPGSDEHTNFTVWTLGIMAICFSQAGSYRMADITFNAGQAVTPADPLERAAFDVRLAYHRARFDWHESLRIITGAVTAFRDGGDYPQREDYSLPYALAHRGIILGYGYQLGHDAADPDVACRDFQEAAGLSAALPRTQLVAVSGIARTAVKMWMSDHRVIFATPNSVVSDVERIRRALRHNRIPLKTIVDGKARWMLGLGYFMLAGRSLTRQSERYFVEGRADLAEVSSPLDVVEMTLDYQWCLIEDGRFVDARAEYECIAERVDALPPSLRPSIHRWGDNLTRGHLRETVVRDVFDTVRGVRQVLVPGVLPPSPPSSAERLGW